MCEFSGLLLAAGLSSRMGKLKALLPWQGRPLIQYQIEQMQKAGVNEIIVVLGFQAEQLQTAIAKYDVKTVINEDYEQGKSSSIRMGAAHVHPNAKGIFISAVDQPVPRYTLKKIMQYFTVTQPKAVIPVYQGKRGHPILVDASLKNDLLAVNEKTEGLRAVIQKHQRDIAHLKVNDSAILFNFNTEEAYRMIRK